MLNKVKNRKEEGFTIIEVLIVLAIAGLIIAIVLFAVPALQRNGRNTAIKSDASNLTGYISDFQSDNDGAAVVSVTSPSAGAISVNGGAGTTPATGKIQSGTTISGAAWAAANATVVPTAGTLTLRYAAKCPDTAGGANVATISSPRSVAVVYATEAAGGTLTARCVGT